MRDALPALHGHFGPSYRATESPDKASAVRNKNKGVRVGAPLKFHGSFLLEVLRVLAGGLPLRLPTSVGQSTLRPGREFALAKFEELSLLRSIAVVSCQNWRSPPHYIGAPRQQRGRDIAVRALIH